MNVLLFIEKIAQNRLRLLVAFVATVSALLSWLYVSTTFFDSKQGALESGSTSQTIESFLGSREITLQKVQDVKAALRSRVHASPGYQQKVAQKLLATGYVKEALPLIEEAAKRVDALPPYYKAYSKVSVLIEKGEHQEAYQKAKLLKEQLFSDSSLWDVDHKCMKKSGTLAAFTLIKLCALEQSLGLHKEELTTLHALKTFLGLGATENVPSSLDEKTRETLLDHYRVGTFTLKEYIFERERVLRRK